MRLSLVLVVLIPLFAYVKADSAVRQISTPTPVPYVPLTRTITQSITCSKSVANACAAGRRKRDILTETDIHEQFAPSAVRDVERTVTTVTHDFREMSDASEFLIGEQRSAAEELDSTINIDAQERAGAIPVVTYAIGNIGVFLEVSLSVITVIPACSSPGTMFQCPLL